MFACSVGYRVGEFEVMCVRVCAFRFMKRRVEPISSRQVQSLTLRPAKTHALFHVRLAPVVLVGASCPVLWRKQPCMTVYA